MAYPLLRERLTCRVVVSRVAWLHEKKSRPASGSSEPVVGRWVELREALEPVVMTMHRASGSLGIGGHDHGSKLPEASGPVDAPSGGFRKPVRSVSRPRAWLPEAGRSVARPLGRLPEARRAGLLTPRPARGRGRQAQRRGRGLDGAGRGSAAGPGAPNGPKKSRLTPPPALVEERPASVPPMRFAYHPGVVVKSVITPACHARRPRVRVPSTPLLLTVGTPTDFKSLGVSRFSRSEPLPRRCHRAERPGVRRPRGDDSARGACTAW